MKKSRNSRFTLKPISRFQEVFIQSRTTPNKQEEETEDFYRQNGSMFLLMRAKAGREIERRRTIFTKRTANSLLALKPIDASFGTLECMVRSWTHCVWLPAHQIDGHVLLFFDLFCKLFLFTSGSVGFFIRGKKKKTYILRKYLKKKKWKGVGK